MKRLEEILTFYLLRTHRVILCHNLWQWLRNIINENKEIVLIFTKIR